MTGSLQTKNGYYYAVLSFKTDTGDRKTKWFSTGLKSSGNNIRKAKQLLSDLINKYDDEKIDLTKDYMFTDYIRLWLDMAKMNVDEITWQGYESYANKHVVPYFEPLKLNLRDVTPQVLQQFCNTQFKRGRLDGKGGLSAKSVKLHFVVIHQALKEALRKNLIPYNPAERVTLPKDDKRFKGSFYSVEEVNRLLEVCKDEPLLPLIYLTVYYGLRRSEALGLKWSAVDFKANTLTIKSTVVKCTEIVEKDKTKNQSSNRTYPLIPDVKKFLQELRISQLQDRILCGNGYNTNTEYVFRWPDGTPFSPDYVSQRFEKIIRSNGLRKIRFHDLRHSCASILLSMGYSLKDIQEWLGHADIKMTGNVYGHLDVGRKACIAESFGASVRIGVRKNEKSN